MLWSIAGRQWVDKGSIASRYLADREGVSEVWPIGGRWGVGNRLSSPSPMQGSQGGLTSEGLAGGGCWGAEGGGGHRRATTRLGVRSVHIASIWCRSGVDDGCEAKVDGRARIVKSSIGARSGIDNACAGGGRGWGRSVLQVLGSAKWLSRRRWRGCLSPRAWSANLGGRRMAGRPSLRTSGRPGATPTTSPPRTSQPRLGRIGGGNRCNHRGHRRSPRPPLLARALERPINIRENLAPSAPNPRKFAPHFAEVDRLRAKFGGCRSSSALHRPNSVQLRANSGPSWRTSVGVLSNIERARPKVARTEFGRIRADPGPSEANAQKFLAQPGNRLPARPGLRFRARGGAKKNAHRSKSWTRHVSPTSVGTNSAVLGRTRPSSGHDRLTGSHSAATLVKIAPRPTAPGSARYRPQTSRARPKVLEPTRNGPRSPKSGEFK